MSYVYSAIDGEMCVHFQGILSMACHDWKLWNCLAIIYIPSGLAAHLYS